MIPPLARIPPFLVAALSLISSLAAQESALPPNRPLEVLPEDGDWDRLRDGVLRAEAFRQELLESRNNASSYARNLVDRILEFQTASAAALGSDRPSISQFNISRDQLLQSLESDPNLPKLGSGFEEFRGEWFGSWDSFDVDHNWGRSFQPNPFWTIQGEGFDVDITEIQYAWIGDGFGWNVVVSPKTDPKHKVILGAVYHSSVDAPRTIRFYRPHVGARPGPNQLIWITRGEVFLEEIRPVQQDYVITGFYYERDNTGAIHFRGDGFQAIYSRNPAKRTPFHQFPISTP